MHFKFKTIALCSFLFIAAAANETQDKSQIFNDKYLNSQKLDPYRSMDTSKNVDFKISNIRKMTEITEENNSSITNMMSTQLKSKNMRNEVLEINTHRKSKTFQKEIKDNENYLLYDKQTNWQQHLGKYKNRSNKTLENLKAKNSETDMSNNQFLNYDEKIFIIISSSMPKHILQNYFQMLQNVNTDVTFVLRGTIGGVKKVMPTLNWIQEVLTKADNTRYEYNIMIEPRIVSKYKIEQVPAVLYIKNYHPSYIEENSNEEFYTYYGAIDIDYALKKINENVKSRGLKNILDKI